MLDELQKELKNYQDLRDSAIKNNTDFGWINEIITGLEQKIAALPEPEPETVVEVVRPAFELPTNYNIVFSDSRANEEISGLIAQVEAQLIGEHKAELEVIYEAHRLKLNELQSIIDIGIPENERLTQLVSTLTAEKLGAESKRDNAVAIKEVAEAANVKLLQENKSLNGQIDELEKVIQSYKKPIAAFGLSLTTSLKPETDEEKQARLTREKMDLINQNLSRFDVKPLPTKEELVTSTQLDDSFRSLATDQAVASNESTGAGVSEAAAPVEQAEDGSSKLVLEKQLYADVAQLKQQMIDVMQHLTL